MLAGYSGDESWTEQEEIQVRRKIDWRLMPVLCVTYGLQYYDKAMLSQAVGAILVRLETEKLADMTVGALWPTR